MAGAADELTTEKLDETIQKMDSKLSALKNVKRRTEIEIQRIQEETAQGAEEGAASPFRASRKKAVIEIMEPLGRARDFMNDVLKGETGTERPRLHEIFGRDNHCQRVEHIRELVDVAQRLVAKSYFASDKRWQETMKACESIEAILRDAGLGAELKAARAKAAEELADIVPQGVRRESVMLDTPVEPVLTRSISNMRKGLFLELDLADHELEVLHSTTRIFESYGKGKDDVLEGRDYENVIKILIEHVQEEAARKAAEHGLEKPLIPNADAVKNWVLSIIDPNGDELITFEEGLRGFKAVVDDIETDDDLQLKTRKLTIDDATEGSTSA